MPIPPVHLSQNAFVFSEPNTVCGEIYRYAKVCRVSNVIRPYMEAL